MCYGAEMCVILLATVDGAEKCVNGGRDVCYGVQAVESAKGSERNPYERRAFHIAHHYPPSSPVSNRK